MNDSPDVAVDVAILGGGIAGLWLLDALCEAGYSAILFEADALGAGQSVASQGIIHGGTKYTLGLALDTAVKELRAMPETWRACLAGASRPDLSAARTLSQHTYMWVPKQLGGGALRAFSRLIMRSHVRGLARSEWPDGLYAPSARGAVYALDEVVLDTPSVLAALRDNHPGRVLRIPDGEAPGFDTGSGCLHVAGLRVRAERFIFTAGAGNEALLSRAGIEDVGHQRRPLHQVLVGGMKQAVFAHCVGKSTRPLATVTSHPGPDGSYVWNVGGSIAERGVDDSSDVLVERARHELPRLFPGADFGAARWATFRVDRAEGATSGGFRPGGPMLETRGRFTIAWPTKLALAPALAARVLALLREQRLSPGSSDIAALGALPVPAVARPPWETIETWS